MPHRGCPSITPFTNLRARGDLMRWESISAIVNKRIARRPAISIMAVLLFYSIVAAFLFSPIVDNILRSDYWFIRVLFGNTNWSPEGIKNVATFELLGNPRSQPLAHLLLFARYTLLGYNIAPYHILNIGLHVANGFLVFLILSRLNTRFSLSAILGLLFIVLTSQFDTVQP